MPRVPGRIRGSARSAIPRPAGGLPRLRSADLVPDQRPAVGQMGMKRSAWRAAQIREGRILAVKGLGGFHLACDATNAEAVADTAPAQGTGRQALRADDARSGDRASPLLRQTRPRPSCSSPASARSWCSIGGRIRPSPKPWRRARRRLGVMLPYTPLHVLLLRAGAGFSGCAGDDQRQPERGAHRHRQRRGALQAQPHWRMPSCSTIARSKPAATTRLFAWTGAKRLTRSGARAAMPRPRCLCRSTCLRCWPPGAELKNTFCLTRDRYAFLSHHIGDLENYETLRSF